MIDIEKLNAYSDGELSKEEKADVDQKLSTCRASQAELLAISQLKSQLRKIESVTCESTWQACRSRLNEIERVTDSGSFFTRYSWAFVSVVALIVLIGGGMSRSAESQRMDTESLAGFFASRSVSRDPKTSKAIDLVLKTVDSRLSKATILGSQDIVVAGRSAKEAVVIDRIGEMRLLVLPNEIEIEGTMPIANEKYLAGQLTPKLHYVSWIAGDRLFVLVGEREHLDLLRTAKANFVPPTQ